jgi:hypothetical protein
VDEEKSLTAKGNTMGSNRSGVRRTARMKRAKKLNERLAKKTAGDKSDAKKEK